MITFKPINHPIPASRKRVVSMWFGDVDRLSLLNTASFTGAAILVAILSLSGTYQYYVVFQSLSQQASEIWAVTPADVKLTDAPAFEKELLSNLNLRGISLAPLLADSTNYSISLSHIPVAYDDENETAPAGLFSTSDASKSIPSLDNNEIYNFKQLLKKA